MAHRSILGSTYEPEMSQLDAHVKWITPGRRLVPRATETLSEVCTLALLVILAAKESVKHRRTDAYIEQLREYGDWVD
jgi:hypothetical protein